jgi:hypothetical protein
MTTYTFWTFVHILLFVFWLGTDIGVIIIAGYIKRPELSYNQRMLLLRIAGSIDMWPRTAFVLMLPAGTQLAVTMNLIPIPTFGLALIWLFSLTWLAIVWAIAMTQGRPISVKLERVQLLLLVTLGLAMTGIGVMSLVGEGPIKADWLAVKVVIYGAICGLAIGIDRVFKPLIATFLSLEGRESTPEDEAAITRSMNNTIVFVLLIYLAVVLAAFAGVTKLM